MAKKSKKQMSYVEMRKSALDMIYPVVAVRLYSDILCSLNSDNPNYVCPIRF